MRILITGGQGQLGLALGAALANDSVVAPGHTDLDVTNPTGVREAMRTFGPEVVIHAAAWTDTAGCERDPARAMAVNAEGARCVAEAATEAGARTIYIGSNEVFNGAKGAVYTEDDVPHPINEYGRSKHEGERAVQSIDSRSIIVRTSWLYGPGRVSFPEKIVEAAARGSLRLVTDEIASPTWTVDLAQAIARLIRTPEATGVFHLTNTGACSRKEWAEMVLSLAGISNVTITPAKMAEFGLPYSKPAQSALANIRAAALGIELRGWQDAMADHFRTAAQATLSGTASGTP